MKHLHNVGSLSIDDICDSIKVKDVKPSTYSYTEGAVDASLEIVGTDFEVTLIPRDYGHGRELSRWGDIDNWADANLVAFLLSLDENDRDEVMTIIVERVREKVEE